MEPILIVDDSDDILNIIENELGKSGHDCLKATCIDSAIEILKENKVSCIFLDIIMSECESSEKVLQFIRSEDNQMNVDLPIIIMSAAIDGDFIERNRNKVFDIIEKPFERNDISDLVAKLNDSAA